MIFLNLRVGILRSIFLFCSVSYFLFCMIVSCRFFAFRAPCFWFVVFCFLSFSFSLFPFPVLLDFANMNFVSRVSRASSDISNFLVPLLFCLSVSCFSGSCMYWGFLSGSRLVHHQFMLVISALLLFVFLDGRSFLISSVSRWESIKKMS